MLNGITSPPKRTAMINGRTFETGESGEVKLPTGAKALIKPQAAKHRVNEAVPRATCDAKEDFDSFRILGMSGPNIAKVLDAGATSFQLLLQVVGSKFTADRSAVDRGLEQSRKRKDFSPVRPGACPSLVALPRAEPLGQRGRSALHGLPTKS